MRQLSGVQPFESSDPDSQRIWWQDVGVHQNLTFPVHPDPISGMHCWHQKVKLEKAPIGDSYGDIFVGLTGYCGHSGRSGKLTGCRKVWARMVFRLKGTHANLTELPGRKQRQLTYRFPDCGMLSR
jgi:hypothetical protein